MLPASPWISSRGVRGDSREPVSSTRMARSWMRRWLAVAYTNDLETRERRGARGACQLRRGRSLGLETQHFVGHDRLFAALHRDLLHGARLDHVLGELVG